MEKTVKRKTSNVKTGWSKSKIKRFLSNSKKEEELLLNKPEFISIDEYITVFL